MDRNCDKCIHHTSGMCDSWDCKMQTVEDVKREAVKEYVEAVVAELEKKAEEYNEKADRYSVHEDYFIRYLSIAKGIEDAIEIVRGKE